MTNKKFKVAAMSMALTACVAAQPLIANAADDVNAVSNDAPDSAPQSEEGSSVSAPVAIASEGSSNTEVKAEEKQDMLAPDEHLGEYSEPKTDTDGNSTSKADITKDAPEQEREPEIDGDGGDSDNTGDTDNTGNTGDTDNTDNTGNTGNTDNTGDNDGTGNTGNTDNTGDNDGTGGNGALIGGSGDSGSTDGEIKEQIPIGDSTLTEKPGQSSTVVTPTPGADPMPDTTNPPKVTTNPDGSVDIETPTLTPGTETTTTTASGEVKAESHTETPEEYIDLNKELGEKRPDWNTQKDAEFNGYKVSEVQPSDDGNSKTLTLTKTKHLEGQMGSDELAKFTNSTKKVNVDGTYDLVRTETYTDKDGQQRTRTTTLHVKDNEVTVDTTITLIVALEKGSHDVGSENISHVKLPDSITATDKETGDTKTINAAELERLMAKDANPTIDGSKTTYKVKDGDLEYTIEVDEGASRKLTNAEIFEKLEKMDSGKYQYDKTTDTIYYIGNGDEHAELTKEQNDTLRKTLSYTVTVTETAKDGSLSYDGSKSEAEAFEKAATAAKTEARNNAVKSALKELGLDDTQVQQALTDGTFDDDAHTFTYTLDGKTYTLKYTEPTAAEDPSKVTNKPDADGTIDTKEHTVNGSTYVTTGTISWETSGADTNNRTHTAGSSFTVPEGFAPESSKTEDGVTTTTYVKETRDGNTVTRETYVVTERDVTLTLSEKEKEELAWNDLLTQHPKYHSIEDLKAAGYKVVNYNFDNVKQVDWSASKTTSSTTTTTDDINKPLVDSNNNNWKIEQNAASDPSQAPTYTITIDKDTYRNVTKNADGTYTCTRDETRTEKDEAGKDKAVTRSVTYIFTEAPDGTLTDAEIRGMLAGEFGIGAADTEEIGKIVLDKATNTATYTSKTGETTTTITINYGSLSKKKLDVKKEVHGSTSGTAVVKTEEEYQAYCRTLLKRIKDEILPTLAADEKLFVGDTEITGETTLTDEIIAYFKKAISPEDMDPDEIVKALKEQERIAKSTTVTVNKGNEYQEDLKDYYSGASKAGDYFVKEDGTLVRVWERGGEYYDRNWNKVDKSKVTHFNHADTISHLDLASGSKLELLPEEGQKKGSTVDCVLVSKGLELKWNDDAEQLVKNNLGTTVGLQSTISKDTENGKSSHFEYDRGKPNNHPSKSAFYKLTGTVAYDAVKTDDNTDVKLFEKGKTFHDNRLEYDYYNQKNADEGLVEAVNTYLKRTRQTGKTYDNLTKEELNDIIGTYVVELGRTQNNQKGPVGYQVYLKSSSLEAYGYMSRDANTCVNKTYQNQGSRDDGYYLGGYDLMISNLIQVREGKVIGSTESTVKNISALWSIRSAPEYKMNSLLANSKNTTTNTTTNADAGSDSCQSGNFSYTYQYTHPAEKHEWSEADTTGTGTGHYTSFRKLFTSTFTGNGTGHEDSGSFRYTYRTEKDADLAPVSKVTKVDKTAHITYDSTTVESRDVLIPGTEIVHIDPDGGGDDGGDEIIDEKDSDSPILPGTPELPPVQDARPDAPVLPADPALPAVQDAHALPQTGVNWLAAIGLALSGMTLMITGAFASLTGKNAKH